MITNLEWRFPLKYMDRAAVPLLPSFAVKAIYGTLFTDTGYDWTKTGDLSRLNADHVRNSVGAGLRFPCFAFQSYPLTVSLDMAKRTDAGRWVWYLSLGPEF